MKVLSWNMQGGSVGGSKERMRVAWDWLKSRTDLDVLLLQETQIPGWAGDRWKGITFNPKVNSRGKIWGSAILSKDSKLATNPLIDSSLMLSQIGGSFALAQPQSGEEIWFGSLHSSTINVSKELAEIASQLGAIRSSPSKYLEVELFAHEFAQIGRSSRFIVGGDLNLGVLFDISSKSQRSRKVFANLIRMGWHDIREKFYNDEIQTFFRADSGPFQLDHLYADERTLATIQDYSVLDWLVTTEGLSDHAPIEISVRSAIPSHHSQAPYG